MTTSRRMKHMLTLRADDSLVKWLRKTAKRDRRSVGAVIRGILIDAMNADFYADPKNRKAVGPAHHRGPVVTWHNVPGGNTTTSATKVTVRYR